jgi:NADP-dependent 3-hydroxy acid dehydrogenase YdfG
VLITDRQKIIAIYGAGPGLGMAAARRFGRQGFRVVLVSRNLPGLEAQSAELARLGIAAAVFVADLRDRKRAIEIVDEINTKLGPIDVLVYAPHGSSIRVSRVQELDLDDFDEMLDVKFRTAVGVVQAVLPNMLARNQGTVLFTFGPGQRRADPNTATLQLVDAATYHYALSLSLSLAHNPVYVGALLIYPTIAGSRNSELGKAGKLDHLPSEVLQKQYPTVSSDDLADRLWDMYVERGAFEVFVEE